MPRKMAILTVALILTSCTNLSMVAPKKVTLLDSYSVVSPIHWTSISGGHGMTWTDDGPLLQYMTFFAPIEGGQRMFRSGGAGTAARMPRFDPAMTPIEIAELVVATYTQIGRANVRASDIRPTTVGGAQGFRFDMTFTSEMGVDYNGVVVGTVRGERLYLIIYAGARLHYFDKRRDAAEKVIQTIDFGT